MNDGKKDYQDRSDIGEMDDSIVMNVHCYVALDVLEKIQSERKRKSEHRVTYCYGDCLYADIIDLPLSLKVKGCPEGLSISVFLRTEKEPFDQESDFHMIISAKDGNISDMESSGRLADMDDVLLDIILNTIELFNYVKRNKESTHTVSNEDIHDEVFLVKAEDEDLIFINVSGREYPTLTYSSVSEGDIVRNHCFDEEIDLDQIADLFHFDGYDEDYDEEEDRELCLFFFRTSSEDTIKAYKALCRKDLEEAEDEYECCTIVLTKEQHEIIDISVYAIKKNENHALNLDDGCSVCVDIYEFGDLLMEKQYRENS